MTVSEAKQGRGSELRRIPQIDVCICTYKRPRLLSRLLDSVLHQESRRSFVFGVIVVDNDADASAEPVVRTFTTQGLRVAYDIEPEQNISLARNRCLAHASGDFIAIIDDDEEAEPLWLYHLFQTMLTYNADAVFGPVVRYFDHDPPPYVGLSGAFMLPDPPTGSRQGFVLAAGNVLIRRSILQQTETPFDPGFGRTGGGDSNLFIELKRRGHRLVWCTEARVREWVAPERANWRWILQRDFRVGNNTDRIHRRAPPDMMTLMRDVSRECGMFCTSLLTTDNGEPGIKHLRRIAWALGRIAHRLGIQYEEYAIRPLSLVRGRSYFKNRGQISE